MLKDRLDYEVHLLEAERDFKYADRSTEKG